MSPLSEQQVTAMTGLVVDEMVASYAPLRKLGERGRRFCEVDTHHHFEHLGVAVELAMPALFATYARWVCGVLVARNIPADALRLNFGAISHAAAKVLDAQTQVAVEAALAAGRAALDALATEAAPRDAAESSSTDDAELDGFFADVTAPNPRAVVQRVSRWLAELGPHQTLTHIARSQARLGDQWAQNHISVLVEHRATALTQVALGLLVPYVAGAVEARPRGPALVACVEGDWHSVGARIGADLLELSGYRVDFLGANLPTRELIKTARDLAPKLIGLSVTPLVALPPAVEAVRQLRKAAPDARLVAGGFAARAAGAAALGVDEVMAVDFSGLAE